MTPNIQTNIFLLLKYSSCAQLQIISNNILIRKKATTLEQLMKIKINLLRPVRGRQVLNQKQNISDKSSLSVKDKRYVGISQKYSRCRHVLISKKYINPKLLQNTGQNDVRKTITFFFLISEGNNNYYRLINSKYYSHLVQDFSRYTLRPSS